MLRAQAMTDALSYRASHNDQPGLFVRPSTDQSEWLLGPETTWQVLKQLLKVLDVKKNDKILIPGIGMSSIAFRLANENYTEVTATDIDEDAIAFQTETMEQSTKKYKIRSTNLLKDESECTYGVQGCERHTSMSEKYKLIIDKSTLDVWVRDGNSGATVVLNFYERHLAEDGVIICISMFHRKIKSQNRFKNFDTLYSSITQRRGSRTRPEMGVRIQSVAIYVNFRTEIFGMGKDPKYIALENKEHTILLEELPLDEALKIPFTKRRLSNNFPYKFIDLRSATLPEESEDASCAI